MTAFESWRNFWTFSREVAPERRYIRTPQAESFLAAVAAPGRFTIARRARVTPTFQFWMTTPDESQKQHGGPLQAFG
jgi:hypothetical protein